MATKRRKRPQRPVNWEFLNDLLDAVVPVLEDYYPDYPPDDIMALASLCLVQFNTSERGKMFWNADLSDYGVRP